MALRYFFEKYQEVGVSDILLILNEWCEFHGEFEDRFFGGFFFVILTAGQRGLQHSPKNSP